MTATTMPSASPFTRKQPLRTLLFGVALLAIAVFGDDVYGMVSAGGKAPAELTSVQGPVHVIVEIPFEPERYHLEQLSRLGSYAGRDGEHKNRIRLLRVSQENLTAISRRPWVTKIEPVVING